MKFIRTRSDKSAESFKDQTVSLDTLPCLGVHCVFPDLLGRDATTD